MKHEHFVCRLCHWISLIAILLAPLTASAAKVTVLLTQVESEVIIRERNGNSGRIIKQQKRRENGGFGVSELTLKHKSGTLGTSGRGFAQFFGNRNQLDPSFHCQAKGENTSDSTAPSGHSGDNVTTFSTVKMVETLVLQGQRFGAFTFGDAKFQIDYRIHGNVEQTGDTSVAHGRIELKITDADGSTAFSSLDPGTLFDGQAHNRSIVGKLSTFSGKYSFTIDLLAVACIAKYKKCMVNADLLSTVEITGVSLLSPTGERFEAPEIASASGIDYGPLTNPPSPGTGAGELAFASDLLAAEEDDGTLIVKVNRDAGGTGPASVVIRNKTAPGAGADFEAFSTTLDFAEGETQKFVVVKIVNGPDDVDFFSGNARMFEIELVNPTGATLSATRNEATVTVFDDDSPNSVPDPGPAAYTARINPGGAPGETGLLSVAVDANGTATFKGVVRGKRFAGRSPESDLDFSGDPKTVNISGIGAAQLRLLRFKNIGGLPRILGTLTLPDATVLPIRGVELHAQEDGAPPTSKRGTYTLLFERGAGAPVGAPLGSGFARVKVLSTGKVIITGKLADGAPFSAGGTLNLLRDLPLLVSIAKTKSTVEGVLHFRSIAGVSDIDGDLRWVRPGSTKPGPFATGFTTTLAATGGRFVPTTTGSYILPHFEGESGKAIFHAESPDLAATLDRQMTIGVAPKNTATADAPNLERLAMKLNGSTGLWTGSFLEAGRTLKFSGALLQPANRGGGYFLGATQSGRATLAPGTLTP